MYDGCSKRFSRKGLYLHIVQYSEIYFHTSYFQMVKISEKTIFPIWNICVILIDMEA